MEKRRHSGNDVPRSDDRGGEWRVFTALAVLTVGMICGLYLIARNASSSGVNNPDVLLTPVISTGEACANFANYWMVGSGVAVDASVIEGLTNCWLSVDGEWFVPTGPRDPRLPADVPLTEEERAATAMVRRQLLSQIYGLESWLSPSIERDLESIYDPRVRPISGHIEDGQPIGRQRSRYTRVVQAYLMAPEHELLADYVAWLMADKINAYETLRAACEADPGLEHLRNACLGIEDSMSVRYPPWIWDLRNSVALERYLAYLVRTNRLPEAESTLAAEPTSEFAAANHRSWRRMEG